MFGLFYASIPTLSLSASSAFSLPSHRLSMYRISSSQSRCSKQCFQIRCPKPVDCNVDVSSYFRSRSKPNNEQGVFIFGCMGLAQRAVLNERTGNDPCRLLVASPARTANTFRYRRWLKIDSLPLMQDVTDLRRHLNIKTPGARESRFE